VRERERESVCVCRIYIGSPEKKSAYSRLSVIYFLSLQNRLNKTRVSVRRIIQIYIILSLYSSGFTVCTAWLNVQQFYVLSTDCIYVFCVDLRTISDYLPVHN